jgi:hypothetical protein
MYRPEQVLKKALDLGYDKTILAYHLRYVKLSHLNMCLNYSQITIYLGVLGITLQETNMEPSEKFAFTVVVLLGMFYIAFPFITWEYKNLVLLVNGVLFLTWTAWAVVSNVCSRYKLVAAD